MTNRELQKKWDKTKENVKKQGECFNRVPLNDPNYDTYCEEMQHALVEEERCWKKAEGRLY